MLVHGDALGDGRVSEDDEAEAAGAARAAVPHDDGLGDLPEAAEVVAEAVLARLPRDAADEELPVVGDGGGGGGLHRSRLPVPFPPLLSSPLLSPLQPTNQPPTTERRDARRQPGRKEGTHAGTYPHSRARGGLDLLAGRDAAIAELRAGRARSVPDPARSGGAAPIEGRASVHEERAGGIGGTLTGGSATAVARRDPSAIGGRRRVKKRQAGGGAEEEEEEWGCGAADGGMIELERKSGGESGGGRDLARSLSHPRRVAWLAFFIQHRQADTGCSRSAPNTPPPILGLCFLIGCRPGSGSACRTGLHIATKTKKSMYIFMNVFFSDKSIYIIFIFTNSTT